MNIYVALLRGINVGGKKPINMTDLKSCFERIGYNNVKTYINSGNVIFQSNEKDPRKIESKIEAALEKNFSHSIKVVVCSLVEMKKIIKQIPKKWASDKNLRNMVIFLRHTIDNPRALADIKARPGVEELHYYPGVLLWSAKFSNITRSSVMKINQMALYKDMTVRNLNTTQKIYQLMQEA
jgi:uncharacterized protein (DUF1697 family)